MARKKPYPDNILHDLKVDGATVNDLDYSHLTERESCVIQMYYMENKLTLKAIAAEFEVCEQRMRQIIGKALRKIRKSANTKVNMRQ